MAIRLKSKLNVEKKNTVDIDQIFSSSTKKTKKTEDEIVEESSNKLNETSNNETTEVVNEKVEKVEEKVIELKDRVKKVHDHYTINHNDFLIEYTGCEGRPFHLGLPFRKENTNNRHFFCVLNGQKKGQLHVGPEHGHTVIDNNKTVVNFSELKNFFGAFTEDGSKWYSLDNKGTLGKAHLHCISTFLPGHMDVPIGFEFYGHHTDLSGNFSISKYSSCLKYNTNSYEFVFCSSDNAPMLVKFQLILNPEYDCVAPKFLINNEVVLEGRRGKNLSEVFMLSPPDSVKIIFHSWRDIQLNNCFIKITQIA